MKTQSGSSKLKPNRKSNRDLGLGLPVILAYIAVLMLFFSSGDGVTADFGKWILFGRASTGTGGGGFWSSNSVVSTSV
ncbi:hypothetical protein PVK06_045755 [Gossypium arboreum]|uniref:Uncharacterized protein n=1 Tax=Gossypium arboreum TaxID=29729 RepID=A0ABR0MUZ9_GOSAR|nr:hypothetical protein PVK06_045755 [Gossypium arboreum]